MLGMLGFHTSQVDAKLALWSC